MDPLYSVLSSVAISSLLSTLLTIAVGKYFDLEVGKDIEKYKNELSLELEKNKKKLEIDLENAKIEFSKLHTVRAKFILDLYRLIAKTDFFLSKYTSPVKPDDTEKVKKQEKILFKTYGDMVTLFMKNKILLNNHINKKIELLNREIASCINQYQDNYMFYKEMNEVGDRDNIQRYAIEMKKAWEKYNGDIQNIKKDLEREFKILMGVKK